MSGVGLFGVKDGWLVVFLSLSTFMGVVHAYPDGITGYSDNPSSPFTCGSSGGGCHFGGSYTGVASVNGSATVARGSLTNFTLNLSSSSALDAGFNLSVSGGTLNDTDNNAQKIGNELTHVSPQALSGSSTSWTFSWTAPVSSADYIFYYCINQVNRNRNGNLGDGIGENLDNPDCGTTTITVNDPPTISNWTNTLSYNDGDGNVTADSDVIISDTEASDSINRAEITLTNPQTGDDLDCGTLFGGIACTNSVSSQIILTGTASRTNYMNTIRSILFENTQSAPNVTTRTLTLRARDSENNWSSLSSKSIIVDDRPNLSGWSGTTFYNDGDGEVIVDGSIAITDNDNTQLNQAVIILTDPQTGDDLDCPSSLPGGIGCTDGSTQITLSNASNISNYVTAIQGVTFANILSTPNVAARTISLQVRDTSNDLSDMLNKSVDVDDRPNISNWAGTLPYTEGDGQIVIDNSITLSDNDHSQLNQALVQISNPQVGDSLVCPVSLPGVIACGVNGAGDLLTFSGADSLANYEAAIESALLQNSSENPSESDRTIALQVRDTGSDSSDAANKTISVTAVNDAPEASGGTRVLTAVNENTSVPVLSVPADFTDAEGNTLTYAVISGTLPPGVSLSSVGDFSGTPTVPGVYIFTVEATETDGAGGNLSSNQDKDYSWTINENGNDAPVANGGTRTLSAANENTTVPALSVPTDFTDEENNNLTYAVISGVLPPGVGLSLAGDFSGTPTVPGVYLFTVEATETNGSGGNLSSNPDKDYSWTINENGNDAPMASGGTRTLAAATEDAPLAGYSVASDFSDEENNTLNYAVTVNALPAGINLNASTGDLTGTPTVPGMYSFSIRATETDGAGGNLSSSDKAYEWEIVNVNDAPQITTNNGLTLLELTTATITSAELAATDEDTADTAGVLTYTITSAPTNGILYRDAVTLTNGSTFTQDDINNNLISYEETVDDATSDSFVFDLDDAAGDGPTGVTFNITVTLNAPPVVTAGGSLDYGENDGALALADAITVTDVESDDIVSATVQITGNYQNGEDVLGFVDQNGISGSFNPANGMLSLSGTATIGEYQAALRSVTYTNTSEHPSIDTRTASFRVSDANLSNTATRDINVTRANDAPTSDDRNININEDTARALVIGDFTFNDVDSSDTLAEVRIVQIPGDGSLTLSGAPVSNNDVIVAADLSGGNLVFTPDLNETGSPYATIQFQVSDGTVFSSPANTLTINVGTENDAPQEVGGTVTLTAVDENVTLSGVTVASGFTDAENNDLDYALTSGSLPTGVNLTAATGELTGSPTVAGVYGFGITATETDGDPSNLSSMEQSFSWTINEAFNDTPQAIGGTVTLTATNENVSLAGLSVAGDFADEDSNDLDYAVTAGALPAGVSLDTATGELSGTPTVPGDYAFSITATETDGNPANLSSVPQDYSWQIIETVNDAPVIAGGTITLPVAVEAIALSGVGTAGAFSDEEDNTLSYSVTSGALPSGVSLNAASGELTGTPAINGVFNFGITATETDGVPGDLSSAEQAFSLTVTEVNDAPVTVGGTVVLPAVIAGDPVAGVSVTSAFSDEENNTLTYFISGGTLPSGVTLNAATGALEGIPMSWSPPAFDFNVVATETNGIPGNLSSVAQAFSLTVNIIDTDADTVPDFLDNCPLNSNVDQFNNDADSDGNVCDDDDDNDGMPDTFETDNGLDPFDAADAARDADGDGRSNLDEFLAGGNPNNDDVPPAFNGVQDIVVDAIGYLTPVELGDITAADVVSGPASVSIESVLGETSLADVRRGLFRTGRTVITRSAIDSSLNVGTVEQTVDVRPLANFAPDLVAAEGGTVQVVVLLNGVAPQYPVTLDYTVSGSSDGADHNAADGTVTITAGTEGAIDIDINPDALSEGDETLVLTLSDPVNAALGGRTTHTVTIVEGNAPPVVEPLQIQQGLFTGPLVVADRGLSVTVMAVVNDPNAGDTSTYEWSGELTQINAPGGSTFEFDPAGLAGIYILTLTVTDNNDAATTIELLLNIKPTAPVLSSVDSDSDGIADDLEGYADSDGDGVPDHLDAYEAIGEAYLGYNQTGDLSASRLLETEPGLAIRLGALALHENTTGILVDRNQITSYASLQGIPLSSSLDSMVNIGGLYDFEIHGLQPGGSAKVVIPLMSRMLEGAVYRKFSLQNGWRDFSSTGGNSIASARSVSGLCPAPGHASYRSGLNVFDDCVQLTLVDGGPNDADGEVNGVIRDPGGVAVADVTPAHETPEPDDGSGGGALHPWLLFGLFGWLVMIICRQRVRG